jgi:hypothetical protein
MACRITKKREKTARLLLESKLHTYSTFLTLTIADDDSRDWEPGKRTEHSKYHQLEPDQLKNFIKRLRKNTSRKVTYYAVGEYGEHSGREHYHLVLFGWPFWDTEPIKDAWSFGSIMADELTPQRAAYIVGYVLKKMTSADDERLGGKNPEFSRQSLKPALTKNYFPIIARELELRGKTILDTNGYVSINGKYYPLDAYSKKEIMKLQNVKEDEFQKWLKCDISEDRILAHPEKVIHETILTERKIRRIYSKKRGKI